MQICISIPPEWVQELDARAKDRGISRSSLVSLLLYDALANEKRKGAREHGET